MREKARSGTMLRATRLGPFLVDHANARLLRDGVEVRLRPKTFEVLAHLVRAGGSMIGRDELLRLAWPGIHVSQTVLKVCIRELRQALGDDARNPRYVATVHTRGYRLVAPGEDLPAPPDRSSGRSFVAREAELRRLDEMFATAEAGRRRGVFVTGEAGIGKSWVVDRFAERVAGRSGAWILRGQCIERLGTLEAYQPILDAIGNLEAYVPRPLLADRLASQAPTLLAQLPALWRAGDEGSVAQRMFNATKSRLVREIVAFFEACSRAAPIVLVIEDLHFADAATLDVVAALCRRTEPARLLSIFTCRHGVHGEGGPFHSALCRELVAYGDCEDIDLDVFSRDDVEAYLLSRFPGSPLPPGFIDCLSAVTRGHPLFVAMQVDDLVARGLIAREHPEDSSTPYRCAASIAEGPLDLAQNIRAMIVARADVLSRPERAFLDALAVARDPSTAQVLSAMLRWDVVKVESIGEGLARSGTLVIREDQRGADGEMEARYYIRHALLRSVLYERVGPNLRAALHLRLAEHIERTRSEALDAAAALLAFHFERGRALGPAIQWLRRLAQIDVSRWSISTAVEHVERALALSNGLAEDERARTELELLHQLAHTAAVSGGIPRMKETFERLRGSAQACGAIEAEIHAIHSLAELVAQSDPSRCIALVEEAVARAEALTAAPHVALWAHGVRALWRSLIEGSSAERREVIARGAESIARTGDPWARLSYDGLCATVTLMGNPCAAARIAAAVSRDALALGSHFRAVSARLLELNALLLIGDWSGLPEGLREFERSALAADDTPVVLMVRLFRSILLFEARAYEACVALCEANLPAMRDLGFVQYSAYALALIARCRFDLGDRAGAAMSLKSALCVDPASLWYESRMLLLETSAELALAGGDIDGAEAHTSTLGARAAAHDDRAWLLRVAALRCKLAVLRGSASYVDAALACLRDSDDADWPLAAWRLHEAAARALGPPGDARHAGAIDVIITALSRRVEGERELVEALSRARIASGRRQIQ